MSLFNIINFSEDRLCVVLWGRHHFNIWLRLGTELRAFCDHVNSIKFCLRLLLCLLRLLFVDLLGNSWALMCQDLFPFLMAQLSGLLVVWVEDHLLIVKLFCFSNSLVAMLLRFELHYLLICFLVFGCVFRVLYRFWRSKLVANRIVLRR